MTADTAAVATVRPSAGDGFACPADIGFLTGLIDAQAAISTAGPDPDAVLRAMLEQAQRICGGDGALFNAVADDGITCRVGFGSLRHCEGIRVDGERSLSGAAVRERKPILCDRSDSDARIDRAALEKGASGTQSFIVVPLPFGGRIIGVLMVAAGRPAAFNSLHAAGMQMIAGMLAAKLAQAEAFAAHEQLLAQRSAALDALRVSEARFRLLADNAPVGIFECDASGNCTFLNERWLEMTGAKFQDLLGVGWVDSLHPDDRNRVIASWLAASQAGVAYSCEYRLCTRDGRTTWVHAQATAVRDEHGAVTGHIGTAVDITDRKRRGWLEVDRGEVLEMLACGEAIPAVLRRVSAGVARQIDKLRVAIAAPGHAAVAAALADAGLPAAMVDALRPMLPALLAAAPAASEPADVRIVDLFVDPAYRDVRVIATVHRARTLWIRDILGDDGATLATMICCLADGRAPTPAESQTIVAASRMAALVIDSRQKSDRIAHAATHDLLTALPNRATYRDRLGQAIIAARRVGEGVGVVAIDVDAFKAINDTRGHAAGDAVLRQFAARLRAALRQSDTLARLGGDEFAAVLPRVGDAAAVAAVGRKLVDALAAPFDAAGGPLRVTGSFGIACFPSDGDNVDALLAVADEALYVVKARGRNGWHARAAADDAARAA